LLHAFTQLPQWVASDATHEPPQSSRPAGHLHWLAWQLCPPLQTVPQPPQLLESDDVSTHAVPHAVCPAGQLTLPPEPVAPAVPVPPPPAGLQAAARIAKQSPKSDTRAVFIFTPFNFWDAGGTLTPAREAGAGAVNCRRRS
jgi:hypothetical protein